MNVGYSIDWRFLALVTVLCWGAYNVILKAVAGRMAWQVVILWYLIGYVALVAGYCIISDPSLLKARFVQPLAVRPLLAGFLCGIGAIAFFKALPIAAGSILMPLVGLYVLVSAAGCLFFFGEPLTWRVAAGIVCAVTAVVLLGK